MGHSRNVMEFKTIGYLSEEGVLSKECKHIISDEELLKGYRTMVLTRQIDDRMITLQRQGTISFAMSSLGEEASVVASAAALEMGDWLYPQYRENGIMFWRGWSPVDYIHHMFCNGEDLIKGRQMPNHFGDRSLNVVTVSSPLATQLPQAAGAAYAMQIRGEQTIALAYFGEGTASKGDFHVGLNFAALRKAPVIYFCRNNGYAISTPSSEQFATDGVAPRGPSYGIETFRVDGNDYFAVHETVARARNYCLAGNGPVLIEAMTYRMGAHSTSDDPKAYRDDAELEEWEKKDPILRLRRYLEQKKLWDAEKETALLKEIGEDIDAAIEMAKAAPPPPLESIAEDVYFEMPPRLRQQLNELRSIYGQGV
ncbi:2-oxoisovalerate dehydrogenase subunit alpha, mitochondrial [Chlamydiales bacterium SCGC AG-110-P3]|nr:2-oxoisovalerate dehydrogenase subunit alpha, mitochondrial [Chlamydiales bacterium SCGC AG-110-P3]